MGGFTDASEVPAALNENRLGDAVMKKAGRKNDTFNDNEATTAPLGALYQRAKIPGKGMAMIASRDIKCHEFVLEERPDIVEQQQDF